MLIGQSLGRYEVLELLGEGGMGVVYRALDTQLGREVAIKVLREDAISEPKRIERFEREARAVARLSHPNILEIYDFGHDQGVDYAVMELLEGETLRRRLVRSKLPRRKLLQIAEKVADGLGAAHREGVVHRDLKPENIFLTSDGRVKILDFGVAHLRTPPRETTDPTAVTAALTDSGTIVGTLSYMSPEQIRGREVTAQSDIFAFGSVLYEMISRRQAFPGGTTAETVAAILEEDPPPLSGVVDDLPFTLEQIVHRCLEKQPADRYESARDVAFALNGAAEALKSGSASQPRPSDRDWRSPRTAAWAFGGTLVAAAVAVGIWLITQSESVPLPEEKHLAVIGFESPADDLALQRFAAGLTETVADGITLLEEQTLGKLWVVTGNARPPADGESIGALRRANNINLAVTGRLERNGDRLDLNLILVDSVSKKSVRTTVIESDLTDLSSLQMMPLQRIAEMLGIELTQETLERLATTATSVSNSFEAYVRARGLLAANAKPEDVNTSVDLLQSAVDGDPLFQPAYERLAAAHLLLYEATGDRSSINIGLEHIVAAIDLKPTANAYRTRGALLLAAGEPKQAVIALVEATRLAPASAAAQMDLAHAYQELEQIDDARRAFQRAINRRPGCWRCEYDFAYFNYLTGEDDAAANGFRQAIRAAPDNYQSYNALGGILFNLDQFGQARGYLEQSLEIEPVTNYSALSNLGTINYFEARFSEATEMYLRALEQDDHDYLVWGNLGFAQTYAGDLEGAEGSFHRAIEMANALLVEDPDQLEFMSDLASYHAMIGERSEALALQESATARLSAESEVPVTIIETFEIVGDRERALQWVETALARGMDENALDRDPTLRGLVADERFRKLVDSYRGGAADPDGMVPAGS